MSLSLVDRIIYCNPIFTVFADKHLYFNMFSSLSGCWHLLLYVVIDAMLPQVKSVRTDSSECFCINFSFLKNFCSCHVYLWVITFLFSFWYFPSQLFHHVLYHHLPDSKDMSCCWTNQGPTQQCHEKKRTMYHTLTQLQVINVNVQWCTEKNKIKHASLPNISMLVQIGSEILW